MKYYLAIMILLCVSMVSAKVYVIDTPTRASIANIVGNGTFVAGSCPAGYAVQNTTITGVQCIPLSAGSAYFAGDGLILSGSTFALNYTYSNARWNDTDRINAVNSTSNIKTLGFNTTIQLDARYLTSYTESDPFYNRSWNQSKGDALYYSISNPSGYITGYVETDPFYNRSWNQSKGDALYYSISNPSGYITGYVETDPFYNRSWNQTKADGLYLNYTATVCYTNGTGCPTGSVYTNGTGLLLVGNQFSINTPYLNGLYYSTTNPNAYININDAYNGLGNFSANNATLWNAINNRLNLSDQRFNETVRINDINSSLTGYVRIGSENQTKLHCNNITGAVSNLCTVTGGTGSGDGTGGWINTSTNTNTNTNASIMGSLNVSNNILMNGVKVYNLQTYFCDFMATAGTTMCSPNYLGASVGTGGGITALNDGRTLPGSLGLASGTGANSGYQFTTGLMAFILNGSEEFRFNIGALVAGHPSNVTFIRLGFLDSITSTVPTEGAYFQIITNGTNSTIGAIQKNSSHSNNSQNMLQNFTLNQGFGSWYAGVIKINPRATSATYMLYNSSENSTGELLWNVTMNNSLPNKGAQYVGSGIVMWRVGAGIGLNQLQVDYIMTDIKNTYAFRFPGLN